MKSALAILEINEESLAKTIDGLARDGETEQADELAVALVEIREALETLKLEQLRNEP